MKKILNKICFLMLLWSTTSITHSYSQNLITDPGFDMCSSSDIIPYYDCQGPWDCPTGSSMNWYHWEPASAGTSDQLNACNSGIFGVPLNALGWQEARSHNGYGGFYAYSGYELEVWREYLSNSWYSWDGFSPMEAGKTYCYSFYLSLADRSVFAINKIGVRFKSGGIISAVNLTGAAIDPPSLTTPDSIFYDDKINWTLVSGTYVAQGGENAIIIGNFADDDHTDTLRTYVSPQNFPNLQTYYYIEDVCVSAGLSCVCDGYTGPFDTTIPLENSIIGMPIPNVFTPNGDENNEYFHMFDYTHENVQITIFNRWGERIFETNNWRTNPWNGKINGQNEYVPSGTYYYVITDQNGYAVSGFLNLIY